MQKLTLDDILIDLMSTIRERRLVDAELDEICCDFEALTTDYNCASQHEGHAAGHHKTIIHESLEALEQEIRARLAKG